MSWSDAGTTRDDLFSALFGGDHLGGTANALGANNTLFPTSSSAATVAASQAATSGAITPTTTQALTMTSLDEAIFASPGHGLLQSWGVGEWPGAGMVGGYGGSSGGSGVSVAGDTLTGTVFPLPQVPTGRTLGWNGDGDVAAPPQPPRFASGGKDDTLFGTPMPAASLNKHPPDSHMEGAQALGQLAGHAQRVTPATRATGLPCKGIKGPTSSNGRRIMPRRQRWPKARDTEGASPRAAVSVPPPTTMHNEHGELVTGNGQRGAAVERAFYATWTSSPTGKLPAAVTRLKTLAQRYPNLVWIERTPYNVLHVCVKRDPLKARLVQDDPSLNLQSFERGLKNNGLRVLQSTHGATAVKVWALKDQVPPDAVPPASKPRPTSRRRSRSGSHHDQGDANEASPASPSKPKRSRSQASDSVSFMAAVAAGASAAAIAPSPSSSWPSVDTVDWSHWTQRQVSALRKHWQQQYQLIEAALQAKTGDT